jgi:site-specific DNA-methyltransferase (adenine-specific)
VPSTNTGNGAKRHPTEKPVMLLRQLIEASSLFGETVLDPFMGAGSTLVAAKAEGRKAIGVEVDERYCEIAASRMGQDFLALA